MKKPKNVMTRYFKIMWAIELKPNKIVVSKLFERPYDAWKWALWNYKGRDGWRLKIVDTPIN